MTYRISVIIAICKQQVIWHASGVDQQTLQEVRITTHCSKKESYYKLHIIPTIFYISLSEKKL